LAYVSLYRKYRSQTFEELLGQEHVTTVLKNALDQQRVAHAYLFCGPRGCGKTSTARLLARALNCTAFDKPTSRPCGSCPMCTRIRDGSAIDVVEMDAASETGIDDVREKIIENARYAPVEARFKIYIIDEVHDLSQKAFDSLLKTIEEPPGHVVFVLATTESHKVPLTIRSRCQRMDFRRGRLEDLHANLRRVVEAERLDFEPEALYLIARAAEGSFRDSLSLLEQVMAFADDGGVTSQSVRQAIGAITTDTIDAVMSAVRAQDLKAVYEAGTTIVASGADTRQALVALQEHVRDLLVVGHAGSPEALGGAPAERLGTMKEQSSWFAPGHLLAMLDTLCEAERDLRFTNQHRLVLERALWQLVECADPVRGEPGGTPQVRPSEASMRAPSVERKETRLPPSEAPAAKPGAADSREDVSVDVLRRLWPRVRTRVVQKARSAASVLTDDVVVAGLEDMVVILSFKSDFARDRADRPKSRALIEEVLSQELRLPGYRVRCVLAGATGETPGRDRPSAARAPALSVQPSLIEQTAEALDGEVVEAEDA